MCGKVRLIKSSFLKSSVLLLILFVEYCVYRYAENQVSRAEWAWQLSDQLDGLSWDKMSEGRPFVFIQVSVIRNQRLHLQ